MARRRSRSADASDIANEPLDSLLSVPSAIPPLHPMSPFDPSLLPELEDTRTFHPEAANRPPLSLHHATELEVYEPVPTRPRQVSGSSRGRQVSRPYSGATQNRAYLSPQVAFRDGDRVAICIRRKRRKEVLHALRKTGRGSRGSRRYNRYSFVRC